MYKIYAQIGFNRNRQTFNKRFASTEKSPAFQVAQIITLSRCPQYDNFKTKIQILSILRLKSQTV
jgi:hypothetical protein